MTDRLPSIEPDVRDLLAATRDLVQKIGQYQLRLSLQFTDAERGLYAAAALEQLFPADLQPLVAAHDALASVLNAACPNGEPIVSLTTENPA